MLAEVFLMVLLAGISGVLALAGLISWKRSGNMKIGLVAGALLVFLVKGAYMSYMALTQGIVMEGTELLVMDVLAVGLLYLSVLK